MRARIISSTATCFALAAMPKKRLLPALLVTLALGGCFPYHYTQRPGVTGTVVDAQSGAPIRGALVSVVGYGMRSRPQDDVFDVRSRTYRTQLERRLGQSL